jgi:glycosyltransferase involved in cell wall biosynthesis
MNNPKISVLMPVFNGEKFIDAAIKSILNQSFTDFEFLIIDDGSTDSSLKIIQSHQDIRIRLLKNTLNQGLAATLNKGIIAAKGEFIVRMDCDDISHDTRIEKQLVFMGQNPEIGISGTWMVSMETNETNKYPQTDEECRTFKFFNSPLAHPTVIIKRELLISKNLMFSLNYPVCEDFELWRRCMQHTKLGNLCEPLLSYRVHGSNLSIKSKTLQTKALINYYNDELSVLGITPGSINEELHFALIRPEISDLIKSKYTFSDFELWSNVLVDHNTKNKVFEKTYFENLLKERLTIVALHYLKSWPTWYYYHKSVLTSGDFFFKEFFRFAIKVLIEKFKKKLAKK